VLAAALAAVFFASFEPARAQPTPTAAPTAPAGVTPGPVAATDPRQVPVSKAVVATSVVTGLEAPWGMAFLPNGDLLVTELLGQLRYVRKGRLEEKPIEGVPSVAAGGQGGLMDVTLHPDFARNRLVYLSHSHGDESSSRTRVIRGELRGRALKNVQTVFEVSQGKPRLQHNGSRFAWLPDKTLLVTIGDGGNPPTMLEGGLIREQAQNLDSHLGKIVRIHDDGRIPADNPFLDRPDAKRELYSAGHRNPQGLARDPVSGRVYATEHGSQGGDELNLIEAGANYGWPRTTYALEYGPERKPIAPQQSLPGMKDPLAVWTPAIAPSGLTVYRGKVYPQWDGDVFAGALRIDGQPNPGALLRIDLDDSGNVLGQERIDLGAARVRDVRTGPDGKLYVVLTDTANFRDRGQRNGRIVRLDPAQTP
jgi:glucose/arabinose dehydrogenase